MSMVDTDGRIPAAASVCRTWKGLGRDGCFNDVVLGICSGM